MKIAVDPFPPSKILALLIFRSSGVRGRLAVRSGAGLAVLASHYGAGALPYHAASNLPSEVGDLIPARVLENLPSRLLREGEMSPNLTDPSHILGDAAPRVVYLNTAICLDQSRSNQQ